MAIVFYGSRLQSLSCSTSLFSSLLLLEKLPILFLLWNYFPCDLTDTFMNVPMHWKILFHL